MSGDAALPERLQSALILGQTDLWQTLVDAGVAEPSVGLKRDLDAHLEMLAKEFSGRPVMLFLHAGLSVLIRRRLQLEMALQRFFGLWDGEAQRLAAALDSRWLVSAMDSFVDHGRTPQERAQALSGSMFMNTIKLYETERHFTGQRAHPGAVCASMDRAALDDGMSTFVVGHGDMIRNLMQRARQFGDGPTGVILQELIDRSQKTDSVFRRFRAVHVRAETQW